MHHSRVSGTIGVDIGTSSCKAVLLDSSGRLVAAATAPYPTQRSGDGAVTQDPHDWVRAVESTLREVAACGAQVRALGLTAPAHVVVLAGADEQPLLPALLAFDSRSAGVAADLRRHYGDDFFARTMVELGPAWSFPQLVWLRRTAPHVWPAIRYVLTQKDYIRFLLTGEPAMDRSDASGTALFDPRRQVWIDDLCSEADLPPDVMPPVRPAWAVGGYLRPEWARRTNLPAGIPVAVGATDTAAELVAVGALDAGDSLVKIASTGTVVAVTETPQPHRRLLTYPHAVDGRWYTLAATSTAATAYQWLREVLHSRQVETFASLYEAMDEIASGAPAGAGGVLFLPFLQGERAPYWDPELRAAFLGLSAASSAQHLCRAVLEGVALSLRSCRDMMLQAGLPTAHPFLSGGGMRSRLWRTILVSALGQAGRLADPQGPAVGAAILAGVVSDHASPFSRPTVQPALEIVEPVAEWSRAYDRMYPIYYEAAARIADISHDLVHLNRDEP